ncbi:hypothetical protein HDU78_001207 [Chytriomyces hyalinus]|nr:hypothetical protein HDU78_001207 [Chytriomyces hyalinus]
MSSPPSADETMSRANKRGAADATPTNSSSSDECSQTKTKAKPGRKQLQRSDGENKRSIQMREAQRAHRERKKNYISELEAKVKLLGERKVDTPLHPDTAVLKQWIVSLQAENTALREAALAKNSVLETQVNHLMIQCNALKSVVAAFTGNGLMPMAFTPGIPVTNVNLGAFQQPAFTFDNLASNTSISPSESSLLDSWLHGYAAPDEPTLDCLLGVDSSSVSVSASSPGDSLFSFSHDPAKSDSSTLFEGVEGHVATNLSVSITDIFGPWDVDFARAALRNIPSLLHFKKSDRILDLYMEQADCFDQDSMRQLMAETRELESEMTNACTTADKQKVLDLLDEFKNRNKNHLSHLSPTSTEDTLTDSFFTSPKKEEDWVVDRVRWPKTTTINPTLQPVRDAIVSIPSLSGSDSLVDELCLQFSKRCTTRDRSSVKFHKHLELQNKLQSLCVSEEDRAKFRRSLDIARVFNKTLLDEWLAESRGMTSGNDAISNERADLDTHPLDADCNKRRKPGRKPINHPEGESRRQTQMREAQRIHRERRKNYITELERQVADLSAKRTASDIAPRSDEFNALQRLVDDLRAKNAVSEARNRLLEEKVGQLSNQCSNLRLLVATFTGNGIISTEASPVPPLSDLIPESSVFSLDPILFPQLNSWASEASPELSSPNLDSNVFITHLFRSSSSLQNSENSSLSEMLSKSLENAANFQSLFGPWEVDEYKQALAEIPVLQSIDQPQRLLDVLMARSTAIDPSIIRRLGLYSIALKNELLDKCTSIVDKQKVIDILETFKEKNAKRMAHLAGLDSYLPTGQQHSPSQVAVLPQLKPVRDAIMSIPSLTGADEWVDELCGQFASKCSVPATPSHDDIYFKYYYSLLILRKMCASKEDKTKLMVNAEIVREFNKTAIDEWLRNAMYTFGE